MSKDSCDLANLEPLLRPRGNGSNPKATVTLTATDPYGASASVKGNFILTAYSGAGGVPACPELESASLDGTTLSLSYRGAAYNTPSGLSSSEFTVTVDGRAVTPSSVSVGMSTTNTENTVRTTPVTLTLPETAWAGDTVTREPPTGRLPDDGLRQGLPGDGERDQQPSDGHRGGRGPADE